MPALRLATSPDDLEQVYGFRYTVYADEMRLADPHADHGCRRITDPMDGCALFVLAAWEGDRVVGTCRGNRLSDPAAGDYLRHYRLDALAPDERHAASVTTRLMVDPAWRRTTLAARLCGAMYRLGLGTGVRFDYCDCAPRHVAFFQALGYQTVFDDFDHPDYGPGAVMRLDLFDVDHLRRIGSPFCRVWDDCHARPARLSAEAACS